MAKAKKNPKIQTKYFQDFKGVVATVGIGSWENIKEKWQGQFFELKEILDKINNDLNSPLSDLPTEKEQIVLSYSISIQTRDINLLDELKDDLVFIARASVEVEKK